MEDDKIKELFMEYNPRLSTSFMADLDRRLEAVEMVKARNAQLRRRSRIACVAALAVGFISGFASAIALPHLAKVLSFVSIPLPAEYSMLPVWICVAAVTVLTSLTTYNLTYSTCELR